MAGEKKNYAFRSGDAFLSDFTEVNLFDTFMLLAGHIEIIEDLAKEDGLAVVDSIEAHTHNGKAFYSSVTFIIGAGETYYVGGTTSLSKDIHMKDRKVEVIATNKDIDLSVMLYEDSVWTDGDPVTIFNSDRNLDLTNNAFEITDDVLPTVLGVDIKRGFTIKEEKVKAGNSYNALEYIMKQNSNYMLSFTNNLVTGSLQVTAFWTWYVS